MRSKVVFLFALLVLSSYRFPEERTRQTIDWNYKLRLESKHFELYTSSPESFASTILELAENIYETFTNTSLFLDFG